MHLAAFDKKLNHYKIVCVPDIFTRLSLSNLLDILDDLPISFLEGDSVGKAALAEYLRTRANLSKVGTTHGIFGIPYRYLVHHLFAPDLNVLMIQ